MNQMHYNQEKSPKRTPANVARKSFWDAALGDNSKLANLAKAAITEAEQQAKVREWVGLTDGELRELEAKFNAERVRTSDEEYLVIYPGDYADWQRAIESKLREKNAGLPAADDKAGGVFAEAREIANESARLAARLAARMADDKAGGEPVAHVTVEPLRRDEYKRRVAVNWIKEPVAGPLYTHPQPQADVPDENRCIRELREYAAKNPGTYIFPGWDGSRVTKYLAAITQAEEAMK